MRKIGTILIVIGVGVIGEIGMLIDYLINRRKK